MKDAHERESGEDSCRVGRHVKLGAEHRGEGAARGRTHWSGQKAGPTRVRVHLLLTDLTHERTETTFWIDGGSHANSEVISNGNCG